MPLFNHGKVFPSLENNSEVSSISNVHCPHDKAFKDNENRTWCVPVWTLPSPVLYFQTDTSKGVICVHATVCNFVWLVHPTRGRIIRKVPWFYWKILFFMKFMPSSCCLLLFGSRVGRRKRRKRKRKRKGHKFGDCCLIGSRQTERGLNLQWPPSLPVCPPCHRCWQHVFVQWIKRLFVLDKEGIYKHF